MLGRPPKTMPAQRQAIVQGLRGQTECQRLGGAARGFSDYYIGHCESARVISSGHRQGTESDLATRRQLLVAPCERELRFVAG